MESRFARFTALVERYLGSIFGSIRVYRENSDFLIPWGSTVINVDVRCDEDDIYVHIYSPVALRVKPEKDLLRFLLVENADLKLASFSVEFEKGFLDIILGVKIPSRFINRDILGETAINVGNLANEYGKEIIAVFGGISFKEYIERERKERKPSSGEKILHDIFEAGDVRVSLELYRTGEGEVYAIIGRVEETGQTFLKAERKKELQEVFDLLENIKNLIIKGDIKSLKRILKHYEVEDYVLYNILAGKESEKIKKLKELEKEVQFLTDLLMKGEISQDEYRKRISDIEKLYGL
jgi:hypothetical protein